MSSSISTVIRRAKLHGYGGVCGIIAVAINDVLFGGRGELVAATNFHVERVTGFPFVAHVAVRHRGYYYDSSGLISYDELLAWGQVDPTDADYSSDPDYPDDPDTVFVTELEAHDAVIVPLTRWGPDPIQVIADNTGFIVPIGEVEDDIRTCPTMREAVNALRRAKKSKG